MVDPTLPAILLPNFDENGSISVYYFDVFDMNRFPGNISTSLVTEEEKRLEEQEHEQYIEFCNTAASSSQSL